MISRYFKQAQEYFTYSPEQEADAEVDLLFFLGSGFGLFCIYLYA